MEGRSAAFLRIFVEKQEISLDFLQKRLKNKFVMAVNGKTHSGASKRFRLKPSGLVKRRKRNMRHLLSTKSSKRKRQLGTMTYVHKSDVGAVKKQLGAG